MSNQTSQQYRKAMFGAHISSQRQNWTASTEIQSGQTKQQRNEKETYFFRRLNSLVLQKEDVPTLTYRSPQNSILTQPRWTPDPPVRPDSETQVCFPGRDPWEFCCLCMKQSPRKEMLFWGHWEGDSAVSQSRDGCVFRIKAANWTAQLRSGSSCELTWDYCDLGCCGCHFFALCSIKDEFQRTLALTVFAHLVRTAFSHGVGVVHACFAWTQTKHFGKISIAFIFAFQWKTRRLRQESSWFHVFGIAALELTLIETPGPNLLGVGGSGMGTTTRPPPPAESLASPWDLTCLLEGGGVQHGHHCRVPTFHQRPHFEGFYRIFQVLPGLFSQNNFIRQRRLHHPNVKSPLLDSHQQSNKCQDFFSLEARYQSMFTLKEILLGCLPKVSLFNVSERNSIKGAFISQGIHSGFTTAVGGARHTPPPRWKQTRSHLGHCLWDGHWQGTAKKKQQHGFHPRTWPVCEGGGAGSGMRTTYREHWTGHSHRHHVDNKAAFRISAGTTAQIEPLYHPKRLAFLSSGGCCRLDGDGRDSGRRGEGGAVAGGVVRRGDGALARRHWHHCVRHQRKRQVVWPSLNYAVQDRNARLVSQLKRHLRCFRPVCSSQLSRKLVVANMKVICPSLQVRRECTYAQQDVFVSGHVAFLHGDLNKAVSRSRAPQTVMCSWNQNAFGQSSCLNSFDRPSFSLFLELLKSLNQPSMTQRPPPLSWKFNVGNLPPPPRPQFPSILAHRSKTRPLFTALLSCN